MKIKRILLEIKEWAEELWENSVSYSDQYSNEEMEEQKEESIKEFMEKIEVIMKGGER